MPDHLTPAPTPAAGDALQHLIESIDTAVFVLESVSGGWLRFSFTNRRFLEAANAASAVGRSPADILPLAAAADLEAIYRGSMAAGRATTQDWRPGGNGGTRCWRLTMVPDATAEDNVGRAYGSMVDVTGDRLERQTSERQMRALLAAFDRMDQGIAVWDAEERLIHASARFRQHRPALAGGLTAGARYRPLLWREVEGLGAAPNSGRHIRCVEHAGDGGGVITVTTDETVFDIARDPMARSSGPISAALAAITDAGLWLTGTGSVAALNAQAADWLHAAPEAVIGRPLMPFLQGEIAGHLARMLSPAASGESLGGGSAQERHCDSEGRSLALRVSPLPSGDGAPGGMLLVVRDISETEAAARRLRECEQLLARYMRIASLSEMAGGLAHEVGQPLAAVVNYCRGSINMLSSGSHGDAGEIIAALDDACTEAEKANAIINSITNMIRRTPAAGGATDADAIVRRVCAAAAGEAGKKGVAITFDPPDGLPAVKVNAVELEQVVSNLVKNAAEAAAERPGPDSRVSVQLASAGDAAIELTVSDTGPGFAGDGGDQAFAPFFTTKPGGIGMGLAICRAIVEGHGGRIALANGAGGGAEVRVTLPATGSDHHHEH